MNRTGWLMFQCNDFPNPQSLPLYTEPHIDYSDSQVPASDNAFYVDPPAWDELAGQECSGDLPA